jgi:predicted phosphoribosyltransferase
LKLRFNGNIVYDLDLYNRHGVFNDRFDAGIKLSNACREVFDHVDYVFAIPMGGVPIGVEIAKALNAEFDLLICRKLLIPWNREAGFGAVDPDGNVYVDLEFARELGLTESDVESAVKEQLNEIEKRNVRLRGGRPYPNLEGKSVILVDDGIAAGYTMNSAIKFCRKRGANKISIAVPTGSTRSVKLLSQYVDLILCLNLRDDIWFAVADAYKFWRDLNEDDIMKLLGKISSD